MDIGVWDWTTAELADALYPPDLPEEWRVGFYSGVFRCVALPSMAWRSAGAAAWAEWRDEVPENFGFYLEQGEASVAELAAAAAQLGPLLYGVLLNVAEPGSVSEVMDTLEIGAWAALPASLKLWPVALAQDEPLAQVGAQVWAPAVPNLLKTAGEKRSSAEFQGEIMDNAQSLSQTSAQDALQGYACLGLCCLPALDGSVEWSPLRLRQMLEAASARRACAMAVMPGAEALTVMRQLETLAGLMDL